MTTPAWSTAMPPGRFELRRLEYLCVRAQLGASCWGVVRRLDWRMLGKQRGTLTQKKNWRGSKLHEMKPRGPLQPSGSSGCTVAFLRRFDDERHRRRGWGKKQEPRGPAGFPHHANQQHCRGLAVCLSVVRTRYKGASCPWSLAARSGLAFFARQHSNLSLFPIN